MILYRICTEDKKRRKVAAIVSRFFEGFTIIPTLGYWKGKAEKSLIIEIVNTGVDMPPNVRERVMAIIDEINRVNKQECCLLQEITGQSEIVL